MINRTLLNLSNNKLTGILPNFRKGLFSITLTYGFRGRDSQYIKHVVAIMSHRKTAVQEAAEALEIKECKVTAYQTLSAPLDLPKQIYSSHLSVFKQLFTSAFGEVHGLEPTTSSTIASASNKQVRTVGR